MVPTIWHYLLNCSSHTCRVISEFSIHNSSRIQLWSRYNAYINSFCFSLNYFIDFHHYLDLHLIPPILLLTSEWHPTPVLLPGKSHGRKSLVGCSSWGHKESDTIERLHFHFSLSCIGEGNGNPLHYSCLENPRDGGAWWAAVYGVAQSRTWLKRLSSSSSSSVYMLIWNS